MMTRTLAALTALSLICIPMACSTSTPAAKPANGLPTALSLPVEAVDDAKATGALSTDEQGATVRLVQRPCRFVEAEPGASFESSSAAQCKAINDKTLAERKQHALKLPAGKLTFVVSSEEVPYELGFWIRPYDEPERALVQGGGILSGSPKTYEVTLPPGKYLYSCPLNPTPDYVLIVE